MLHLRVWLLPKWKMGNIGSHHIKPLPKRHEAQDATYICGNSQAYPRPPLYMQVKA